MDVFETIARRRSVRRFQQRDVEPDALRRVLEAANRAPSAGDLQAYEVVVVRDPGQRAALARAACDQRFVARAPVVLIFCANPRRSAREYGDRGATLYCVQDATIAAAFAQLAAAALGLGTVWVGAFEEAEVARIVGGLRPVCIMPLGHPAETPRPTPRRSLGALVHEGALGRAGPPARRGPRPRRRGEGRT